MPNVYDRVFEHASEAFGNDLTQRWTAASCPVEIDPVDFICASHGLGSGTHLLRNQLAAVEVGIEAHGVELVMDGSRFVNAQPITFGRATICYQYSQNLEFFNQWNARRRLSKALGQICNSCGIACLVVIPAEHLDQGALAFRQVAVENATVRVADDVDGDQWIR